MSQIKAVYLDLDGTLIDHFRVIYRCYEYALGQLGLPMKDFETLKATVGGSIAVTMKRLVGERSEEALPHFRKHYNEIWHEDIIVLPGTQWLLENLKEAGYQTACFTNKDGDAARKILERIGFAPLLDAMIGTLDTPYRKPQPEFSQYALEQLGVSGGESIMIGDSHFDVEAGLVVGMTPYTVNTGSHTAEQLEAVEGNAGNFADMYALGELVFGFKRSIPCSQLI